jgi:hypothetical protein
MGGGRKGKGADGSGAEGKVRGREGGRERRKEREGGGKGAERSGAGQVGAEISNLGRAVGLEQSEGKGARSRRGRRERESRAGEKAPRISLEELSVAAALGGEPAPAPARAAGATAEAVPPMGVGVMATTASSLAVRGMAVGGRGCLPMMMQRPMSSTKKAKMNTGKLTMSMLSWYFSLHFLVGL